MHGFCPLASGSKGNVLFLGTKTTRILIDAGLSLAGIAKRLKLIQVSLNEIDGILVSHEHSDHIRGVSQLAASYNIPVFANSDTAKAIMETSENPPRFKIFSTGETFEFGDIQIHPFSIQHDTLDPVGFTCKIEGLKIGICTDLGFATTLVENHLKNCDYLYLESNHDPSMVYASSRPLIYKQRVLSRQGHLSNDQAAGLLAKIAHPNLKHVYLAHLSEECNHHKAALNTVKDALAHLNYEIQISIAYQHTISDPIYFSIK